MEFNNHEQLKKNLSMAKLISKIMIATIILGAIVIELVRAYGWISPMAEIEPNRLNIMRYTLLAMVIVLFPIMKYAQNRISTSSPEKALAAAMIFSAASESAAIPGLILFLISGESINYHLFAAISLVFFCFFYPRMECWQKWLKKDSAPTQRKGLLNNIVWESSEKLVYHKTGFVHRFVGGLFTLMTLSFIVVGIRAQMPPQFILGFISMAILPILLIFYKSTIEIDRSQKRIVKWWQIFNFRKEKVYSLSEFESVRIQLKHGSRYGPYHMLQLYGPNTSLDLWGSGYPREAGEKAQELAEFLGLEYEDQSKTDTDQKTHHTSLFSFKR